MFGVKKKKPKKPQLIKKKKSLSLSRKEIT